jgi:hypothetical protein
MKRVTASEARRNWFRLLDEVAEGTVVCIERGGRRILLNREPDDESDLAIPEYGPLIKGPDAEGADGWGWEWTEGGPGLTPIDIDDR